MKRTVMISDRFRVASLVSAVLGCVASAASADVPQADRAFLDAHVPAVAALRALADSVRSPEDAVELIRRTLVQRRMDLGTLQAKLPLTTLNGIETQDHYDTSVLDAVHRLALAGMVADTSAIAPEDMKAFGIRMGQLPDLGNKPVPFMVLGLAEMALVAADSTQGVLPRRTSSRIAAYVIGNATNRFYQSRGEEVMAASAQNFRESSIVMRLRCPKDGSTYRLNSKQNRMDADKSVTTLLYLQCNECRTPLLLEFPYELATKLNRMADKQKLGPAPEPKRPTSVDP
jgi:hypothetical protein